MQKLVDGKIVEVDDQGNVVVEAKNEFVVQKDNLKSLGVGPLEGKNNDVPVSEIEKDAKDALLHSPGRLSEPNKQMIEKIENEGRAAAERDLESARALGGNKGPNQPENADSTVMRSDGTVTTENEPELTAHYLSGTRVLITPEQFEKYKELLDEMNALAGNTAHADIPLGDPYYTKKAEIDAFVARLKR